PIFPRIETKVAASPGAASTGGGETVSTISIDEFRKLDIRVGEVLAATRVAGTEKLIEVKVDIGGDVRTIVTGLVPLYQPDELVGKRIIVLANLEPRRVRGVTSQGMLLAAEGEGGVAMADLVPLAAHPKVVAVGETGLDYAKDYAPREVQRRVFIEHIWLSRERNLPLIVHCREAHVEVLEILEREQPVGVVMHAFSGSVDIARACVERGYFISLAGPVTFRNARAAAQVAQEVPLGSLLVETDAPVLAPEP